MGSILGLGHDLEICVRMNVQVVVEGDISVQGGVDAAGSQQLDGLLQRVDALHGGTVALGQLHVGGSQTVGGGLAVQVLKGGDVVVVLADGQSGVDVAVRGGEIVGLGALIGHLDTVAHQIVTACVQTGKQAVPVAFHILRLHAQLFGDGTGDFHVIAHEGVALVVEAPGLPCAFQRNDQLAAGLNVGQLVTGSGGHRGIRAGSGGAAGGIGAAGQSQHPGSGHDAHERNKSSAFHNLYILSMKKRFRMAAAFALAMISGKLFLILQSRKICGFFSIAFSREKVVKDSGSVCLIECCCPIRPLR